MCLLIRSITYVLLRNLLLPSFHHIYIIFFFSLQTQHAEAGNIASQGQSSPVVERVFN